MVQADMEESSGVQRPKLQEGGRPRCAPKTRHQASPSPLAAPGPRPRRGAGARAGAGALAQCWRRPDRAGQISCSPVGLRAAGCGLRAAGFGRSHRRRRDLTAHARPHDPPSRRRGQRAPRSGAGRAGAREMRSRRGGAIGATAPIPGRL
ncbi:serine/arginine repetitive matrix protein 3-like [Rattus rattus]|uniref:serine/arginine repetitive matrix protein 3-like n=1 Tax=Rattus rattus TaxID=10117 RepID=UPI0013F3287D|nr:serine/arginine repetitive matrix protein 3-like [Rattus rattus]